MLCEKASAVASLHSETPNCYSSSGRSASLNSSATHSDILNVTLLWQE